MTEGSGGWKILLATDGSKCAERAVAAVAGMPWPDGSEMKVITAVDPLSDMPETFAARRTRAEAVVAEARARVEKTGRVVSAAVTFGSASRVILETATEWCADLIVVGTRGLGAVRGMLVGSVSSAVARAATCNVLVVETDLGAPIRAVMAVDGSNDARVAARRLAELRAPGNTVIVVSVIEPPQVKSLGLLPGRVGKAVREEIAKASEELQKEAEREVQEVAGVFRGAGWQAEGFVKSGVPSREVMTAAREAKASLIGAGPCGVTGLERILLGSVTEQLLSAPGISLLIGR